MHYQAKGRGVQRGWTERALCCGNGCHALVVRATSLALQPCYMSVLPHCLCASPSPPLLARHWQATFFYWCCMDSAVKKFFAKLASEMFDFQWFNKLFIYLRMSQKPLRKTHNQTYLPLSHFSLPLLLSPFLFPAAATHECWSSISHRALH